MQPAFRWSTAFRPTRRRSRSRKPTPQRAWACLQVADGALSQVTSLLNRAVTLATEASNGTLNTTQDAAANQEYQSILSEINNIGSTTTYNQEAVFGSNTNIYTGDSSTAGSSIDDLNIRSLSSSNVGDTDGVMSYTSSATSGANGEFFNTGGAGVGTTDFDATGTTADTLTFNYLTSSGSTATKTVTAAVGESLSNVASAINGLGLGLTATVTNATAAGLAADTDDEGILVTGSIGTGGASALSTASYSGALTSGSANTNVLSGSITLQSGSDSAQTITMAQVNAAEGGYTMADLATYITSDTGLGVTATAAAGGGFTLASAAGASAGLTVSSNLTDTTTHNTETYTANAAYSNSVSIALGTAGVTAIDSGATSSTSATATMNYADAAGATLGGTDLGSQADAQTALTSLNAAISDVAALDGYMGAQINTLNSVSQVLSTQQENVQSAQNAVQATDYASATSNMSKYEILSQTGISALAQANSIQQEVTKLLQ